MGFEICVKHVAGAAEGQECVAYATLTDVVDGRKLRCDRGVIRPRSVGCRGATPPWVTEGDRTIGVGTHERRIVQRG